MKVGEVAIEKSIFQPSGSEVEANSGRCLYYSDGIHKYDKPKRVLRDGKYITIYVCACHEEQK